MSDTSPAGEDASRREVDIAGDLAARQRQTEPAQTQQDESAPATTVSMPEATPASEAPGRGQTPVDMSPPAPDTPLPDEKSGGDTGHAVSETARYIKALAAAVIIGLIVWLAPGPGWWSRAPVVDIPGEAGNSGKIEAGNLKSASMTFFLPDKNLAGLMKGRQTINVPEETEGAIKSTLEELFNSSEARNVLFPPGMEVLGVYLHEKTAIISIGGGFRKNFHTGAWIEILAVYSIVNTVCENFDSYREVRLLINDAEEEIFAAHVDIGVPLAPDYSIVREEKKKASPAKTPAGKSR